jgi:hypothetical protein
VSTPSGVLIPGGNSVGSLVVELAVSPPEVIHVV